MAQVTADVAKRLARLPHDLKAEFPHVALEAEHDVDEGVHDLIESARFNDYIPLLVHKAVRERLRAAAASAEPVPS